MTDQQLGVVLMVLAAVLLFICLVIWLANWVLDQIVPDEKTRQDRAQREVDALIKKVNGDVAKRLHMAEGGRTVVSGKPY